MSGREPEEESGRPGRRHREGRPPTGRLARFYAWLAVWLAPLFVAAVVAATVAAYLFFPSISSAPTATTQTLLPKNPTALQVETRSTALFGVPLVTPYAVVQRDPNGLSAGVQERTIRKALRVDRGQGPAELKGKVFAVPVLNTLGLAPSSSEHGTTAVTYVYVRGSTPSGVGVDLTEDYASYLGPGMHVVGATGAIPARIAQFNVLQSRIHWMEGATVLLILLLVGIAFRAVLAPLLTVLTAAIAFVISQHVLGYLASVSGLTMPNELTGVSVALMLGIVTDYSVFFFTGTRELLREGATVREAVQSTTAVNGPIVFTAGAVVSIGVASLLLGTLGFFRSFGPGMAITVATGLVVSIVFVPAMLRLFGRAIFWPGLGRGPTEIRPWRKRIARFGTTKPVALLVVVATVAGLGALASGLNGFPLGFGLVSGLPPSNQVAVASHQAAQGFAPGIVAPTELLLQQGGITAKRAQLDRLELELERQPGVAGVLGPADQPLPNRYGVALAPNGNAARYAIVLNDDPIEAHAISELRGLERRLPALLHRAGLSGATVGVGGETALAIETVDSTKTSLWRVMAGAFGVNFVFLLIFLRSLLAPLYLLTASALALAATFGVTFYFFTAVLGHEGLPYYIPVAFSVLLLSLGSDYNIFVVGRIWQEADRRPLREAVAVAAPRAGRAIMVAGIALALSFTLLAIVPIEPFATMAFAMAAGILLDTLVVRTLLVPGLIVLFGRAGRWPRRGPPPEPPEDVDAYDRHAPAGTVAGERSGASR
ncbi:MAG: MMPL family transporter [Gaiellaceae bacterium]